MLFLSSHFEKSSYDFLSHPTLSNALGLMSFKLQLKITFRLHRKLGLRNKTKRAWLALKWRAMYNCDRKVSYDNISGFTFALDTINRFLDESPVFVGPSHPVWTMSTLRPLLWAWTRSVYIAISNPGASRTDTEQCAVYDTLGCLPKIVIE